ncbi:hypothetical protein Emag_006621 [Eimeria magna]
MLQDADRVAFYKEAIVWERPLSFENICGAQERQQQHSGGLSQVAGLRVLEVGCGPLALLSLLALQQGATQVDALELNSTIHQFASTFTHQIGIGAAVSHRGVLREKQSHQQQRLRIFRCYSKLFPLSPKRALVSGSGAPVVAPLSATKCAEADSPARRAVELVRHDSSPEAAPQTASFSDAEVGGIAALRTPDDAEAGSAKVAVSTGPISGFDRRVKQGVADSASTAGAQAVDGASNKAISVSADAAATQSSDICFSAPLSCSSLDAMPAGAQVALRKSSSLPAATGNRCVEASMAASVDAEAGVPGEFPDAGSASLAADCFASGVGVYCAAGNLSSATRIAASAVATPVSLSDQPPVITAVAAPLRALSRTPDGTSDSAGVRVAVRSLKHWRKGPCCQLHRGGAAMGPRIQRQSTSRPDTILKSFCIQPSRAVHRSSRDPGTCSWRAKSEKSQQQRQQRLQRKQQHRGCCYDLILHEILGDFASQEGAADVIRDIQSRTNSIPKSIPFAARTFIGVSELPSPCCVKYPVGTPITSRD